MTIDMQALIEQRPHLKDPLEFYARWQRFQKEAAQLLPKGRAAMSPEDSRAYPRESAGPVFRLFVSIFDLPGEEFEPLNRALEAGDIDFMRLPLGELPDISLPCTEAELSTILFLLSRPYFLALRENSGQDGSQWEDGQCPLCSARPALASIEEGPRRLLHCSYCGTVGPYRFIGCPNCGTANASNLNTLVPEEEPGFRISACDGCRTYVKIVDASVLKEMTIDLADMASLPLDIVAQGKEYVRMAPNPIGLKKME
ncbi:MAG: formate dehydrogenase accessory protein FdhE [Desulfobulbaceae bacterium]|nr:formate dehydrogenase accessory protein FdhE [Desulfobulbaceae bacterium]